MFICAFRSTHNVPFKNLSSVLTHVMAFAEKFCKQFLLNFPENGISSVSTVFMSSTEGHATYLALTSNELLLSTNFGP